MNLFKRLPEFEKEFLRLQKKYRSLAEDIAKFERLILANPLGVSKNFTLIHHGESIKIIKTRLACKSLRDRSIRIIYAYHDDIFEFMYIEIYFKGEKPNEDRDRLRDYIAKYS